MNRIHILHLLPLAALGLTACAGRSAARSAGPIGPSTSAGALLAGTALTIDVGVSNVRLVIEHRDSVTWSVKTTPNGCATVAASPERLGFARRDRDCAATWDIRVPSIDDVQVIVSVGDVDVSAPIDRAIRLRSGVGSVRLRLDGRELRHAGAPGSGDRLELGDLDTRPRLDVRVNVGAVRAELRTVAPSR